MTSHAYGYVRVSSDEEGGNNASIAAQAEAIKSYAEKNGMVVAQMFEELNVSGRKLQRKQFDRMMALATSPERPVATILVYALSRFARRLLTQITAEHRLAEAQVRLVSLTETFTQDANGRMMRSIVAIMNEKYAHDASIFTRRDRRGNAKRGYFNGGPVPFGYEARTALIDGNKERRCLAIVEAEAAIVRLIYELAEVGVDGTAMGTRSIAAHLNARGYTLRQRPFFHSNVDGILTREHYVGSYLDRTADDEGVIPSDEDAIVVPCPRIIDPEQVARVVARRAKAAPRVTPPRITNSPVLLTGLVTCGASNCGAGLAIRTGKSGQYGYYTCNLKISAGAAACSNKPIRQDALDAIVLETLLDRVLAPDRLKLLLGDVLERSDAADGRRRADLERARRERVVAQTRLRRLLDLAADGLMSPRDPIFAQQLSEQKNTIAILENTERSLAGQLARGVRRLDQAAVDRFGMLIRSRLASDVKLRRAYARLFVSNVTVSNTEVSISGSKPALEAALSHGDRHGLPPVPSFDREWRRLQDSNL